jgi:hypothetical protein
MRFDNVISYAQQYSRAEIVRAESQIKGMELELIIFVSLASIATVLLIINRSSARSS